MKNLPKLTGPICNKTIDKSNYKCLGHGPDCKKKNIHE